VKGDSLENSPAPQQPSNTIRESLATLETGNPFRELLRLALLTSGAERAYVVAANRQAADPTPSVEAFISARPDGNDRTSKTVLRRALLRRESFICLNAAADQRLARGESVRSLALRYIVSSPLTGFDGLSAALVFDSRLDARLPPHDLSRLADAFAFLLRSVLDGVVRPARAGNDQRGRPELIGESDCFRELLRRVDSMAPTELPVLIEGESGAGKEGIARRLHEKSRRGMEPFVAVNCAAFTETLLDAELFGSVRGAYTGADRDRPGLFRLAQHGTLFLDEVAEMSPPMQAKLLRVLEERVVRPVGGSLQLTVDVRILAATHHNLRQRMEEGTFRQDLFNRLAVLEVRVPPLRERGDDLQLLVHALTPRLVAEIGLGPPRLSSGAWNCLRHYPWPGNIRELHSVLARAILDCGGAVITGNRLSLAAVSSRSSGSIKPTERSLESQMIVTALRENAGNLSGAARSIGWTRQKLYRRMHDLSIHV
jgi:DNA-binding NtrC family response regulator